MDGNNQPSVIPPAPPPSGQQFVYDPADSLNPRSVATPPTGPDGGITWTASEFVAHHKSKGWFGLVAAAALVLAVLIKLLLHDTISAVMVLVAALAFAVIGARKPREITYRLDASGLTVGNRHYTYSQFRSFALLPEGNFSSIVFMPLKRFALLTTIYYDPSDEPKIIDLLSERLPVEDRQHDMVDRLMWRIRF